MTLLLCRGKIFLQLKDKLQRNWTLKMMPACEKRTGAKVCEDNQSPQAVLLLLSIILTVFFFTEW